MISTRNVKLFFWFIGIIFSFMIYVMLTNLSIFSYISSKTKIIFINLILIVLFFFLGIYVSKIHFFLYHVGFKKDKKKIDKLINSITYKKTESKINYVIKIFRKIINYLSFRKLDDNSKLILIKYIGVNKDQSKKILDHIFYLKKKRLFFWVIGFILSIVMYYLINKLEVFYLINQNYIMPILISLVFLLLFFVEGILIVRFPKEFYLDLIKINQKKIMEKHKKIIDNLDTKSTIEQNQKERTLKIKYIIEYLLEQNVSKAEIIHFLKKYDINSDVSEKFIDSAILENKKNHVVVKKERDDFSVKISFEKMHDLFLELREKYKKLKEINDSIKHMYDIEKSLIHFDTNKLNQIKPKTKIQENKPDSKELDSKLEKISVAKSNSKEEIDEQIMFLYNLIKPYTKNYKKQELYSLLLYKGYSYGIVDDVIKKLSNDKNIKFRGKDSKNTKEKVVSFLNSFYDSLSKK